MIDRTQKISVTTLNERWRNRWLLIQNDSNVEILPQSIVLAHSLKPVVIIYVPSGITDIEKEIILSRRWQNMQELRSVRGWRPFAAAVEAGLGLGPTGSMIVDIGGGTTGRATFRLEESWIAVRFVSEATVKRVYRAARSVRRTIYSLEAYSWRIKVRLVRLLLKKHKEACGAWSWHEFTGLPCC